MEVLVFITEAHGDNLTSVLPTPGIDVGILQQIIAHLTLVSGENHSFVLFCFNGAKIVNSADTAKNSERRFSISAN